MSSKADDLLGYLRIVLGAWRNDPRDDDELLARFTQDSDEEAFRILVWRYGLLVWRSCTRVLGEGPDAEDAFQAAFLALARKARCLPIKNLAGWLHQVARRAALNAEAEVRRRQSLEQRLRTVTSRPAEESPGRTELYVALDEELASLPERLRAVLLLHYLEGKTQDEVAHILGCSRGMVRKRLTRAEAILRKRLSGRGLGVGTIAALLTSSATVSAVPTRLIGSTARAAVAFRSSALTGGAAETAGMVLEALSSSLGTMIMRKSLWIVLACSLGLAGAGLITYRSLSAQPDESGGASLPAAQAARLPGAVGRVDCFGDPLPAGALARMGTVRLWQDTKRIAIGKEYLLAFSSDGKMLATHRPFVDPMTVCLWNAATGKEIHRLRMKEEKRRAANYPIVSLGFSRDSKTLVAMDWFRTVCRWEAATGKILQEYQSSKRRNVQFPMAAFLPDGKILAFGDFLLLNKSDKIERRGAYIWDVATGKEICQLSEPKKKRNLISVRAFSPDGKLLATVAEVKAAGKTSSSLSLWDVGTGKEIRQLTYECIIRAVAISSDSKTLASRDDLEICVWEVATGKQIHRFGAEEQEDLSLLAYSPDGKTLLGGSRSENHLWDVETGKEIRSFGWGRVVAALFSSDGKTLAVGDETGAISLWEVATGKEIGPRKGYRGPITSIAYSPDSKKLASLSENEKTVRLWEVATGKEMRPLAQHTGWGSGSLAYSPDGKMLVSTDGVLHLWDTTTGKEIRQFDGRVSLSAAFSPDGKKLAAILYSDRTIRLWEVATGKQIYTLPTRIRNQALDLWPVVFSPDGRLLAAPEKENTISLWEVTTGQRIVQLEGGAKFVVRSLAFSPDSRMLATSSNGSDKIRLWQVHTGKEICQLGGLKNTGLRDGRTLAFSPDGRILATAVLGTNDNGSFDPKVHLWEVASGKEIGQLTGHRAPVRTIAFSPDGKTLASGSDDLTGLVWDVTPFAGRAKHVPAYPLPAKALSKEQLETAWADLGKDAAKAYAAIRALQAAPAQAIPLLRARVRTVAPVADPQQLKRWIADLDDNSFTVRDKAQREIEKLGEPAIPALRQALKGQPSVEVRRRLNDLLTELEPQLVVVSLRRLREIRTVQVLESIGTAEARQVLQAWAKGVAEARLTQEAEAALGRLAKRSSAGP